MREGATGEPQRAEVERPMMRMPNVEMKVDGPRPFADQRPAMPPPPVCLLFVAGVMMMLAATCCCCATAGRRTRNA